MIRAPPLHRAHRPARLERQPLGLTGFQCLADRLCALEVAKMLLESVRSWLGGGSPAPGTGPPFPGEVDDAREMDLPAKPEGPRPAARIEVCEQIWGEGFLLPGGGEEVMRLAKPLGLTSAASLLLVGAGSGGAPRVIASQLGVWVSGFESDPDLAALAMERCTRARLGRRATVEMWYPQAPSFRIQAYHHGLALE